MKYAVFYHVFPGENWEDMYLEQLGALLASKLYEQLDYFYIGFNGSLDLLSLPGKAIACENQNKQEETDTLRHCTSGAKKTMMPLCFICTLKVYHVEHNTLMIGVI